ncbi:asparagine synthase (glutamine-hydrolyzing) [Aliifodinibius sp. S!AR15-10]|uniref:asparagine synthase (glutamine-hydrolyzing) n=1 Tax=Aliifodinibius sp. S!AR15-10 TaxID=2950437 RepID=UPI00285610F4|nr:asparagine synthase (glutamine-hydrolyzing) [Aliifodinibius sp. S!AR15-10]MDR8390256.1 asparagine synthase (glutamine-hydrolyzing) [Aliifodinibius sp. S!AR15-10]
MCGIAGLVSKKNIEESEFASFREASKLMNHRGPDFNDSLLFRNCLLIHYRLSIMDLDPRSNQPFASNNSDYICSYNGEIYNYKELKSKYSIPTRTTSDTEVMLETFAKHSYSVVPEWNGIFALGILHKSGEKLYLIRDRFGIKPLYYFENEDYFAFASEAKVLYKWLESFEIDRQGLAEYLWYGNTISEHTFVKGVKKLEPATVLTFDLKKGDVISQKKYWTLPTTNGYSKHYEDPAKDVRNLLESAVKRQLMSDVPLGVLLSGGIDSSAIVAFASRHYNNLDTYSIEYDFNIGGKSELENAALVANKFGTNHHELKASSEDIADIFSDLVFQYDEPFSDTANIPLYLLAKECSRDKKVILQGDGGDEFFGGYRRYNVLDWLHFWKLISTISHPFIPSNNKWALRMKRISHILNQKDDAMKMAFYLTEEVPYESPVEIIKKDFRKEMNAHDPFQIYKEFNSAHEHLDIVQRMLYADVKIKLNHSYLEKVDKATMLCSLEARVPYLDNDLTQFMLSLPSSQKVRNGNKKYLLRKALRGIVPDRILDGKKRGFGVPYKQWLKEGLFDFAYSTFNDTKEEHILDKNLLKKLLLKHKSDEGNYGPLLWKALVLSHWLSIYRNKIRL